MILIKKCYPVVEYTQNLISFCPVSSNIYNIINRQYKITINNCGVLVLLKHFYRVCNLNKVNSSAFIGFPARFCE